jgi:hypothetical protein
MRIHVADLDATHDGLTGAVEGLLNEKVAA